MTNYKYGYADTIQETRHFDIESDAKLTEDEVREVCDYISHIKGGKGCVRDVLEQTMKIQNKWMDDDAYSW